MSCTEEDMPEFEQAHFCVGGGSSVPECSTQTSEPQLCVKLNFCILAAEPQTPSRCELPPVDLL